MTIIGGDQGQGSPPAPMQYSTSGKTINPFAMPVPEPGPDLNPRTRKPMADVDWRYHQLVGFDLETTGTDVDNDRIVTASLALIHRGHLTDCRTWLVNPGVPIPAEAAAVHGISTEYAATYGGPPASALTQILEFLTHAQQRGFPVVSFNAAFDWSVLDREVARHLPGTALPQPYVLDPYVIDKQVDQYRRGPRTLTAMTTHYGLDASFAAHDATADAMAAVYLAEAIIDAHPPLHVELAALHAWQQTWRQKQQRSLREYLERSGRPVDDVFEEWPVKARPTPSGSATPSQGE